MKAKFNFIILIFIIFTSCNKEYNSIGTNFLKSDSIITNVEYVDVSINQKKVPPFKSINLPIYQLGKIQDHIFGNRDAAFVSQLALEDLDPVFGITSQAKEDEGDDSNILIIRENEAVIDAYLDIPFYNNTFDSDGDGVIDAYDVDPLDIYSDSDGDGLSDILERTNGTDPLDPDTDDDGILDNVDTDTVNPRQGATVYDVDSLIGNIDANFKIKVQELDYFLSTYDPSNNFETFLKYYSDDNVIENFKGKILYDGEVEINTDELVIYKEDDPATDDIDESTEVKERLSPRLRIPIDKDYMQSKIIDKEGNIDLANQDNFSLYFKGLYLSTYDFSDPLLLILNYSEASINIVYEFDKYNRNDTTDDTSDDTIDREEKTFKLNLTGNQINILKQEPYSTEILKALTSSNQDLKRVYLKGGEGIMMEIDLFNDGRGNDILGEIKSNGWLINEANLTLYVDRETIDIGGGIIEPSRIFLYDIDSKAPVIDYFIDNSQGQKQKDQKTIHGGLIEIDEDSNGIKYKIRISEHVKNIIRNDSLNNKLGLVVTSDITNSVNTELKNNDELGYIPISSVVNPLGTILYGPNPEPMNYDKRFRLELIYTELNN
tara:strand:- start:1186 stop:2997 length:1812 start_codon:yes stop_codon:yes gene_type:complete